MLRGLFIVLLFALRPDCQCQQGVTLTNKQAAVRVKAKSLAPNAPISVIPVNAEEEFGRFRTSNDQSFTFYDIDAKTDVTLEYTNVKKIKDGYGGYNLFRRHHTDRNRGLIIILVVAAALTAIIAAAAAAK